MGAALGMGWGMISFEVRAVSDHSIGVVQHVYDLSSFENLNVYRGRVF